MRNILNRNLVSVLVITVILLIPVRSFALTLGQFIELCESGHQQCSEHPIAQVYVGGALDVMAALHEETNDMRPIYCVHPSELFDVPKIIRYMLEQRAAYSDQNAMISLLRYLDANGGC